jgi:hypothetical protein
MRVCVCVCVCVDAKVSGVDAEVSGVDAEVSDVDGKIASPAEKDVRKRGVANRAKSGRATFIFYLFSLHCT